MDVTLQIVFHGMDRSPDVEAFVRQRSQTLERHHSRLTACRVAIDVAHQGRPGAGAQIACKVEVDVPGRRDLIIGSGTADTRGSTRTIEDALRAAFHAVGRQLDQLADIRSNAERGHPNPAAGQSGQVVRLFPEQHYGFVEIAGSPDLYFTENAVAGGRFEDLQVGNLVQVTVATSEGPLGPQASSVRLLGNQKTPA